MLSAIDTCMHACRAAAHLPAYISPFVSGWLLCLHSVKHASLQPWSCVFAQLKMHVTYTTTTLRSTPNQPPPPQACTFHLSCTWLALFNFHAPGLQFSNFLHLPVLKSFDPTCDGSSQVGYPVLLKATGGGGGIGIYICHSKDDLVKNFETAGRCNLLVWDCMGTVCRIADAALIASLSSTCISPEIVIQLVVVTLFELQILQL